MTRIPNTTTVASYAYTVKANGSVIGTIQGFNPSANRNLERVREILNTAEDIVEIIPGRSEFTITLDRLETYNKGMMDALGFIDFTLISDSDELRIKVNGKPLGFVKHIGKDGVTDIFRTRLTLFLHFYAQKLLGVVPLVKCRGRIQAFVTLEPDQTGCQDVGQNQGHLGFAHPRFTLQKNRFVQMVGQVQCGRKGPVGNVAVLGQFLENVLDGRKIVG